MLRIEGGLVADIVIVFLAALLGGLLARFLRLTMLLGYLTVGMIIEPHALRVVS
jgi:predicted Kef-type K+ transport protein